MEEAKQRGALTLGMVNVVGSTIARDTDAGVYLRVGPEIGVASTKAFLGQVMVATLLSAFIGRRRFLSADYVSSLLGELEAIPDHIERVVGLSDEIKQVTARYVEHDNWLFRKLVRLVLGLRLPYAGICKWHAGILRVAKSNNINKHRLYRQLM